MEIALLVIGLIIGVVLGWLVGRSRAQRSGADVPDLSSEVARSQATIEQLELRLEESQRAQQQLVEQHKVEREQREAKAREDASVLEKLAPVSTVINDLKTKVEQMEQARTDQHAEIRTQLKSSLELSTELNKTTQSLSKVMSDNSLRGRWGELQLARVAELAGLRDGVDYELQETVAGEDGRGRPDMIVKLPGGTFIAVDAKAPFNAFNEAMALDESTESTVENRKLLLKKQDRKSVV